MSRLYHNEGGGRFTDVSDLLPVESRRGFTFIGAWGDYDDDGRLDLYLAKDVFGRRDLPVNALVRNDGPGCEGWCFSDISRGSGADILANAMGIAAGDYDNDGDLDLYFSNTGASYGSAGPPTLLANVGRGRFEDVRTAGVNADAWSWGTEFLDFDSDGWLDLYLGVEYSTISGDDRLFRNRGDGSFADVTDRSGTSTGLATYGVATADYNNDGRPDLAVGDFRVGYRLFANAGVYGRDNSRLIVRLRGAGPVNGDACGRPGAGHDQRRQLPDARRAHRIDLGAGSDTALLFGLDDSSPVRMAVQWPDGRRQSFPDVPANSIVDLTYGRTPVTAALAHPHVEATPGLTDRPGHPPAGSRPGRGRRPERRGLRRAPGLHPDPARAHDTAGARGACRDRRRRKAIGWSPPGQAAQHRRKRRGPATRAGPRAAVGSGRDGASSCLTQRTYAVSTLSPMGATKSARVNLRVAPTHDALLRQAAALAGETLSDFLVESGRERAERLVADRARFVLDDKAWAAFNEALGRPARIKPQVRELFARPRPE